MSEGNSALFELELPLPDKRLTAISDRLIGFSDRYSRISRELKLIVDNEGLESWSKKQYGSHISLLDALQDRYPLMIFHGDVGTGKTANAEAVCNGLAKELGKEALLFKLSTRVRGMGNVGEMSALINQAFDIVGKEAGKAKLSFLIIDEADSLAANRSNTQSHHEDKVAVNTLIQKIDDVRRFNGRVVVILCTNHYNTIDPAILRRAAYVEKFDRPNDEQRRSLFTLDCKDLGLSTQAIEKLVKLTGPEGPHKLGYTYSDIRTRIFPDAVASAYPSRKIFEADFIESISKIIPSPSTDT